MNESAEKLFEYFLNQIGGKAINKPYFRAHGWEYYKFIYNDTTEEFCYRHTSQTADATFNNKYLTDGDGLSIDELINLYKSKISLFSNNIYKDILLATNMEYGEHCKDNIRCIGWRKKMAYGTNFKYSDTFKPISKLANFINNNKYTDLNCNKVWQNLDNYEVLLISSNGYNFITTIDLLSEDLHISSTELLNFLNN